MLARLGLRTRIFLLFSGLAVGIVAAVVLGLWLAHARLSEPGLFNAFLQAGIVAVFFSLGMIAWLWHLFDHHVARPVDRLAGMLRARAHAPAEGRPDSVTAPFLGDLAPAAWAAAESLGQAQDALAQAVARETARLSAEKARLETLLADVPVGVLMCSGRHQLVFYNGQATDLVGSAAEGARLDRPLFDYLREWPIRMAHERLLAAADHETATDLLCATVGGARILAARMRLVAPIGVDRQLPGYVLTLRDVTADLAVTAGRDSLVQTIVEGMNRATANLSTLVAALPEEGAVPAQLLQALAQESAAMVASVTELARKGESLRSERWHMSPVHASDLIDGISARLNAEGISVTEAQGSPILLHCDGFGIVSLLAGLGTRMRDHGLVAGLGISVREDPSGGSLRLLWQGQTLPLAQLEAWLDVPLDPAIPEVTGRGVLRDHGTEIWPERHAGWEALCLPLRQFRREARQPSPSPRLVVYDFDLLDRQKDERVAEARLDSLDYVVFDTETTGLNPQQGDEIVQIAAIRIVNGRIVEREVFDLLVHPGRPIPASATDIHGITDAMVANAPSLDDALARFHRFAQGAVLVAHNAPFDMQFLRRREAALGLRFDHPVLDTVLLSAVVFGQHDAHSLDALAHRLGVTIPQEARHTAFGDARATAAVFVRLIRILQGRQLSRFGDVLQEVRRHARLLQDLNGPPRKSRTGPSDGGE